jgi:hypothetical protein
MYPHQIGPKGEKVKRFTRFENQLSDVNFESLRYNATNSSSSSGLSALG